MTLSQELEKLAKNCLNPKGEFPKKLLDMAAKARELEQQLADLTAKQVDQQ